MNTHPRIKSMKSLFAAAIAPLAALALTGCAENPAPVEPGSGDGDAAPNVPPAEALRFDFGAFDNETSRAFEAGTLRASESATSLNWLNAAIRVLYLDAVLGKILTPPAQVLALALHQHPTYQGEGTWLWSFEWQDDAGTEVAVHLYGTVDTIREVVAWEMVISNNAEVPPLVDFLWFEGETSLVDDAGYLVFHEVDDREVARLEWELDGIERSLRFENIDTTSEDYGDFVSYGVAGAMVEVRFHDVSEAFDTVIEWNERTGAGSIVAPDFNEGEPACWDERQHDVECPDGEIG